VPDAFAARFIEKLAERQQAVAKGRGAGNQ
jgi:hypothetical protein